MKEVEKRVKGKSSTKGDSKLSRVHKSKDNERKPANNTVNYAPRQQLFSNHKKSEEPLLTRALTKRDRTS